MVTVRHSALNFGKKGTVSLLLLLLLLGSCNYPGNRGPVWLGEPTIATALDENGDPVEASEIIAYGADVVFCHLSIRGPENFKIFVRWYYEDELVIEEFVDFGKERKAAPPLHFDNGEPLPVGNYRCAYGVDADKPMRTVAFSVQ